MKKTLQLLLVLFLAMFSTPIAVVFLVVRMAWSFSGEFAQNINAFIRNQK